MWELEGQVAALACPPPSMSCVRHDHPTPSLPLTPWHHVFWPPRAPPALEYRHHQQSQTHRASCRMLVTPTRECRCTVCARVFTGDQWGGIADDDKSIDQSTMNGEAIAQNRSDRIADGNDQSLFHSRRQKPNFDQPIMNPRRRMNDRPTINQR